MTNNHSKIAKIILLSEIYRSTNLDEAKRQLGELVPTAEESEAINMARDYSVGKPQYDFKSNPQNRVESIFFNIKNTGLPDDSTTSILPIRKLSLDKESFPFPSFDDNGDVNKLINELLTELGKSENKELSGESLLHLAEKYLTTIPVNTVSSSGQYIQKDITLFDHISIVLGLTLCIEKSTTKTEIFPFLMVGGDISGIQKFIYNVVSKNASKNLKGRSFYLQLLIDSILQRLIGELDLLSANIIYASGGGFYLLAPNTDKTKEIIGKLEEELSKKLWETHQTELYLALGYIELSEHNFFDSENGISEAWKTLSEQLSAKKRQRYADSMLKSEEHFGAFFKPKEMGGLHARDVITGEEFDEREEQELLEKRKYKCEKVFYLDDNNDGFTQPIKRLTKQQIELGKVLPKSKYWVSSHTKISCKIIEKTKIFNPCEMGVFHYFVDEDNLKKILTQNRDLNFRILQFNNTNFQLSDNKKHTRGFAFYGGNRLPKHDESGTRKDGTTYEIGETKNFSDLAGKENANFRRLGFLRMDIDNLGQIFINGLQGQKTFARYKALSRSLDYFFKGYLNTIWAQDKYRNDTYILYSGGDDLFILGRWDLVVDMAQDIRDNFKRWMCENPEITLSGGVAVVTPKFPAVQAAHLAESAEKLAKSHEYLIDNQQKTEKNAFALFDTPLNWDTEFSMVKTLKTKLQRHLEAKEFNESIIGKIRYYRTLQIEQKEKGLNPSWYWLVPYDFSQYARHIKKVNTDAIAFVHEMKKDAVQNKFGNGNQELFNKEDRPYLHLLNLAARWANFEMRTKHENKTD